MTAFVQPNWVLSNYGCMLHSNRIEPKLCLWALPWATATPNLEHPYRLRANRAKLANGKLLGVEDGAPQVLPMHAPIK